METTTKEVHDTLTAAGWRIESKATDTGTYKTPSVHWITLTGPSGRCYGLEFTQGSALRVWSKTPRYGSGGGSARDLLGARAGHPVRVVPRVTVWAEGFYKDCTEPAAPTLDSVLYCVVSECQGVANGETFEEWASEYGYDTDSRKAEKTYKTIRYQHRGLLRIGGKLEELIELFQDY